MEHYTAYVILTLFWFFIAAPALFGGGGDYADSVIIGAATTGFLAVFAAILFSIVWAVSIVFW